MGNGKSSTVTRAGITAPLSHVSAANAYNRAHKVDLGTTNRKPYFRTAGSGIRIRKNLQRCSSLETASQVSAGSG